jgi:hypothetical protein
MNIQRIEPHGIGIHDTLSYYWLFYLKLFLAILIYSIISYY